MGSLRTPAVAGIFYPRDASELRSEVLAYLARAPSATAPAPKAILAPHAGYLYSGAVAGSAFSRLAPLRGQISRVVLMGPAHGVAFTGLALPSVDGFATPLGVMPVDPGARGALRGLPQVVSSDRAHAGEHSLEVELPFVHEVLGDVAIVPIAVGDATDGEAAQVLERLWGGPETCVVISSDLSHYHRYATAQRLDEETARAIEQLEPEAIGRDQACGCVGVRAVLLVARAHGLTAERLDLRNSGDTAGARDGVVGYGAFSFA